MIPATLTIKPAGAIDGSHMVGIHYDTLGANFHMRLESSANGVFTLAVSHFCGDGVAKGTTSEIKTQQARPTNSAESKYQQDAEALNKANDQAALDALTDKYFHEVLEPGLQADAANGTATTAGAALGWARQLEVLGGADKHRAEIDEVFALIFQAVKKAYDKAYLACVSQHDLGQIVTMLKAARYIEVHSQADANIGAQLVHQAMGCFKFRLDINTQLTAVGSKPINQENATLDVSIDISANDVGDLTGQAVGGVRWSNVAINYDFSPCTASLATLPTGGDAQVSRGAIAYDQSDTAHARVKDFFLQIFLPQHFTPGTFNVSCPDRPGVLTYTGVGAFVGIAWNAVHEGDDFRGWTILGGAEYADLTKQGTAGNTAAGGTFSEKTTLKLFHTPSGS